MLGSKTLTYKPNISQSPIIIKASQTKFKFIQKCGIEGYMNLRSRHADKIHQYVGHPSVACQTLRMILHTKIHEGTLELPCKKQTIDTDTLPKLRENKVVVVISFSEDDDAYHPWKNDPKPLETIWESFGYMEKAY